MAVYFVPFLFISVICVLNGYSGLDIDPQGYILYCPCMGRFGNQADHFLGALGFAHGLNRTLVLPPWVEYRYGQPKSMQVPFDTYFKVEPLLEFHRVILMEEFMLELAATIWPVGKRKVFCYTNRGDGNSCNAKDGNPFGPFWDTFSVDFDESVFYRPLNYDVHYQGMPEKWNEAYPPDKYPVLAFTGAPATFPVQGENKDLHQYLLWSDAIKKIATNFIRNVLPTGPFVGIHLRNGVDWVRACEHVEQSHLLFSAPQCLGYLNEHGHATNEMCLPPNDLVLRQLKRVVKAIKARSVFVASDNDHMIEDINKFFKDMKVTAFKMQEPNSHVELAILGLSNHYIGNCISSFSAFAKRERDSNHLLSSFWGFPPKTFSAAHDEF